VSAASNPTEPSPITPTVRYMTLPFQEIGRSDFVDGETLHAFVERSGWATRIEPDWSFRLPTIAVVNGKPALQSDWRSLHLRADDVVEFWSRPLGGQGGQGKQILGLLAVIALSAFAPWAGAALFPSSALGASLASGAIIIAGGLRASALDLPKGEHRA
jgi:hypothetical protein